MAQTRTYGVVLDITNGILKMPGISDVTIKIILKPETAFPYQHPICFLSSIRLYRMHNIGQRLSFTRRREQVYVIRHYDPGRQSIPLTFKVKQGALHHVSYPII